MKINKICHIPSGTYVMYRRSNDNAAYLKIDRKLIQVPRTCLWHEYQATYWIPLHQFTEIDTFWRMIETTMFKHMFSKEEFEIVIEDI